MYKILFVCTGNTCRSAMAEAIARKVVENNKLEAVIESRGVFAECRSRISENALRTLQDKYGLDASDHMPRQLVKDDLQNFDIILTMTTGHKHYIFDNFYGFKDKVLTLREYTENTNLDISDPYGRDLSVYVKCAKEIEQCINQLFKILVGDMK